MHKIHNRIKVLAEKTDVKQVDLMVIVPLERKYRKKNPDPKRIFLNDRSKGIIPKIAPLLVKCYLVCNRYALHFILWRSVSALRFNPSYRHLRLYALGHNLRLLPLASAVGYRRQ